MKYHLNSSGMSLIQVLVAIGLMGVLTTIITSSMVQMMAGQKTIETRQNIISLVDDIKLTTTNGSLCAAGIGAGTQVFDYNLSRTAEGDPIQFSLNNETLQAGFESPSLRLRISELSLTQGTLAGTDPTGNRIFRSKMTLRAEPPAGVGTSGGPRDFATRNVGSVFLIVNAANQIVGCQDESPLNASQAAQQCLDLGGTYNSALGRCDFDVNVATAAPEICALMNTTFNSTTGECNPPVVTAGTGPGSGGSTGSTGSTGGSGSSASSSPTFRWVLTPYVGACMTNSPPGGPGLACKNKIGSICPTKNESCNYTSWIGIAQTTCIVKCR